MPVHNTYPLNMLLLPTIKLYCLEIYYRCKGFQLRFDLSYFLLRFDLAFPLRKPWLPDGQRWVVDQIAFGSRTWRQQNLILNVAVGYPF